MPIKGLTDAVPRFTRAGHIRLGIKKQSARGSMYPEKSDHFIADFESPETTKLFHEIYGAEPKKITIAFAHETPDTIFPQWYKCYGKSSGLKCKGDGDTAIRASITGEFSEVECPTPPECAYGKQNGCKQMASLQFFIRGLPGFQVFQVNTTSWNSIRNINSGLQMLQVVRGDKPIRGVWVDLYLVPQTAQHAGKNVQIYVMKLDITTNLDNLKALECALEATPMSLPEPDESRDEYLTPTQGPSDDATAEFKAACEAFQRDPKTEAGLCRDANGAAAWRELTDESLRGYIRWMAEEYGTEVADYEGEV